MKKAKQIYKNLRIMNKSKVFLEEDKTHVTLNLKTKIFYKVVNLIKKKFYVFLSLFL